MFNNAHDTIKAMICMADGKTYNGAIVQGTNSSLQGVLSHASPFLEFIDQDGKRRYLSKRLISCVEPAEKA